MNPPNGGSSSNTIAPPDGGAAGARSSTPTAPTSNSSAGGGGGGAGGGGGGGGGSNQNFSTLVSTILKTTGKEPPPLVGPSTTIIGDVLYVFGGRILSRTRPLLSNDMHALDLITRVWRQLDCKGQIPPPRYFHSVCALGDSKLVCFGGMSPTNPGGAEEKTPAPGGGGAGPDQNEVQVMSDIHVFDIPTCTWTFIPTPNPPEGRYAHCATILPSTAVYTATGGMAASVQSGERLDGFGGTEMVVVGGQDSANHYIEEVNVFNLRSLMWTSKSPLDRSCGAYRSVVAPLGHRLSVQQIGMGADAPAGEDTPANASNSITPQKDPGAMLIYSNYNFLDVRLELQLRLPDGTLTEKTMNGVHSPPGLRFPNGGILDNHFVVSGTYLTSSKQEYALWALDLRTLIWSRIDAGQVFAQGSWNRGVLWNRRSSFLILGNKGRSLVEDYNHRRINFTNLCKVDLEAFGLYENWRHNSHSAVQRTFSRPAEDFGRMFMNMPELADMEFICMEGETIPVNSRMISKRWGPYFVELLNSTKHEPDPMHRAISTATITPQSFSAIAAAGPPTTAQYNPLDRPRSLYFPHCHSVVLALTEFLYTGSLPPPGDPGVIAPILCSLLQIARPYRVEGLLEAVVERIHQQLDGKNAAAVFNAAATAAGSGSGIEALPPLPGQKEDEEWWESVNIIGLQKRGLRGLMEGRRMRERGKSLGGRAGEGGSSTTTTTFGGLPQQG
ncbi:hypothetical protein FN846DRAFT_774963 [Sphaerosporella brunnea]|uniref:BTB domain-containing protein n=1 Tax=Sphaerosporella brunnea TaxID=1250544 RepID=A0A5J5F2Y7_9PEZI|nr:hypothetical protein FN846DRAFT_774963 [Sphaerosporella brunnea]